MMATLLCLGILAQDPASLLERLEREVTTVVEKARRSVVLVTADFTAEFEQRQQVTESLRLSGVVWSADGIIVSDGSGLERATELKVRLPDGRELPGRILGIDRRTSVAVLRVDAKDLVPVEVADAKDVRQGVYAIVVGNALGLRASAEVGFVSGLGRSVQVAGRRYEDMIQMTSSVGAGDCGAYVAGSRGQLLGIVHSVYPAELGEVEGLGILRLFEKDYADLLPRAPGALSFATPAPRIRFTVERILRHGRMVRGWAGMTVRPLDEAARSQLAIPAGEGCEVWSVDASGPAAGVLKRRDVLLSVDGRPAGDVRALKRWVEEHEQERTVPVVFMRGGVRRESKLTIKLEP